MDAARKQELDNIFNNALKASTNYSIQNAYYGTDSGVDPLSTLGFIDKQTGYDVESKITTALLNGAKSGIKGLLANAGAMVEENIAIHKRQDPNYIPYGGYAPKIAEQFNSLANSEILQRTDVRSSSKLGQFGLDFLEGAGQFVPQIAVTGLTGGIGGGIFMGMSIAGNQYSDLRAQGVDVETAAKASRYNAIIQAPLEQLALGKVLASLPAGSPLKKRLVRLLESAITEGGTEFIQEFPEQLTNIYAQNPNADAKQIATEWDKNWQENIKNAGYSGLIGALLGVGASGAKIAIDSIGENVDAEIHKEKLTQLENNIENVKKSGVNPEYAAGVINTNRPSDFISIDGQKLQQYMQEQGAEKITQALNITEDEVNAAATDGLDVEVPIGDFTAAACKYGDFYKTMQDHISFGDGDYSVNDRKLKKDLRKAYQISENAREELDIEVDKIVENSTNAKMNQEERGALREFLVSQAMIVNPENPAQYFRDHPVEIKRVVSTPKGRYMQTKSANEKLIEDERNFAGIVDEYTAGKINDTKTYNVMTTPLALGLAGGKILPVTIDGSKIKHIFDGHSDGMTPELLKQVPRAMADPMMVLDSYAGRKVVVLDLKDAQGSTIILPLELDVERNRYQVNAVSSAYGKGGENGTDYDWFIEHNLKKGRVSYINKEKTAKWLQSPGSDSASRGNDLDSLLNNSIPDENALRKRREEMQGYYQAAFHGSSHRFEKFDLGAIGTGLGAQAHGWGLYFAENKEVAAEYRRKLTKSSSPYTVVYDGKIDEKITNILSRSLSGPELYAMASGKKIDLQSSIARSIEAYSRDNKSIDKLISILQEQINKIEDNPKISITKFLKEVPSDEKDRFETLAKSATQEAKAAGRRANISDVLRQLRERIEPFIKSNDRNLQDIKLLESIDTSKVEVRFPGSVFEVDIPEKEVMLDEQKAFSEQSDFVKEKLVAISKGEENVNLAQAIANNATGRKLYKAVSSVGRKASETLNKYGIEGISYHGLKDGRCFVVFDDQAIKIINSYNQKVNNDKKGEIKWDEEGKAIISLFEGSDVTTVFHETGHYFVENLANDVNSGKATEQRQKDWETLLDYAGITNEQWLNMSIDERRPAHEKWAEGFETYVMEGKAPSLALRHVFAKMAKWMKRVYESIRRNENAAPLTDEVRQVFDRMLASEEEINTMSRVDGYFNKLPSVITDNLSESSKIRLENYIAKARDEAVDILTRESLRNFTKERRVAIEDFKDKLRPEIRTEVEKQPLYAAGRMLVDDLQKKQTAKGVADYYLGLIARTLDIESKPLSEVEELDVMKFDMIAEAQGFSGDELAKRLIAEPTLEQAIERALDNAVQVKFPDIYKERQLAEDAAREAIYNDDSGLLIGVEQQLIEDMAANINNKQRSTEQALALARARKQQAKLAAKAEISKMSMSNALKTGRFVMAERRAAAQAAKAIKAKSFEEAADYKRQQAFNHALVLESLKMKQEKSRAEKFLKRQFKAKKETWEDEKHFTQAAAIMERMGLKRKDYDPALRKQSLIEYAEEMQEQYDNVAIADWLMDEGTSLDNPAAMTFEQHQDVINALKNIKAIVKQEKYVTWYGKELNYKEFKDEAIRNLLKLKTKWQSGINSKEKAKPSQRFFRNLTNTDNFFERMDGWKYGFFSKHFGESGQIAANKKAAYTMEFEERIADATKKWLPDKKAAEAADKEIYYEPFKASLTKHNIIKMLLYLGSESSSYKLCSVGPNSTYATFFRGSELWVEGDLEQTRSNLLEALGNVLTEADIRYAEEISAACSAHWNELSDMVKRTTGFSPERVDAMPAELTLRNGAKVVFRGGYIPLVRYTDGGSHPATSDAVPATSDKRAVNSIRTLHTNTGGTKARDRSVYPLDLRKGAEYSAVMDNIHDLCYRELATSYRKMLNDPEMYSLLKEKLGIANFEAFTEYLKKTAQPYDGGYASISERDAGTCLSWIRQKAVNVAIMLNFKTAVQNLGNPLLYGNVVEGFGYKDVMAAYGNLFLNMQNGQGWKATRDLVYSKSPFMKERSTVPDISMRDIKDEGRKLNPVEKITVEFGTNVLVATDNISAIPVWLQAYQKKINAGASEQDAVLFADTVIRRTLGSSRITDVAPIQRGSALMKLFTTFQGFFNTQFNQWQREFGIFGREWSASRKAEASKRIVAFAAAKYFMFCLLNLAFALEPPFEEDDDGWVKYSKELLQYPMSLLGPAGQVANALVSYMVGMRTYGYRMTAVQGSFDQMFRTGAKLGKVIQGKAEPEEAVEPLANLGGLIAGVPAQFNKLFFNAYDIVVNDMEPQWGDIYRRRPKRER